MKSFFDNYCTKGEQKTIVFILLIVFIATLLYSEKDNIQKVTELNPDSLQVILQRPNLPNLDIHNVTYEQWVMVPGLGTKKAKAIIEYRDFYGFSVINDLMKVKGIGINTVRSIIAYGYGMPQFSASSHIKSEDKMETQIDLNKATFEQLIGIRGIGNFRAQGIIEMRERVGRFKKFDELLEINGIGPKTVKIIEENTYLGTE